VARDRSASGSRAGSVFALSPGGSAPAGYGVAHLRLIALNQSEIPRESNHAPAPIARNVNSRSGCRARFSAARDGSASGSRAG
jgi:hypothetical protein